MTLLERMSMWWREAMTAPERRTLVAVMPQPETPVPAEYLSLYTYLEHRYASTVVLTFEQLEALLGFSLPAAARMERGWWTGAALGTARHSEAWRAAARVASPNLSARTVAFERLS